MSLGQGNISFANKSNPNSGGGITGVKNGLSLDGTEAILSGFLDRNTEIELSGFLFDLTGGLINLNLDDATGLFQITNAALDPSLFIDPVNLEAVLGDWNNFADTVLEVKGGANGSNPLIDLYVPQVSGAYADAQIFCNPKPRIYFFANEAATGGSESRTYIEADFFSFERGTGIVYKSLKLDYANNLYRLGDIDGFTNHWHLSINDANELTQILKGADPYLYLDHIGGLYGIGDINGAVNGTAVIVDDAAGIIRFDNNGINAKLRVNGQVGITGTFSPVNSITVEGGIVTAVS